MPQLISLIQPSFNFLIDDRHILIRDFDLHQTYGAFVVGDCFRDNPPLRSLDWLIRDQFKSGANNALNELSCSCE